MALAALSMIAKPRYRLSLSEAPGRAGRSDAPVSGAWSEKAARRAMLGHRYSSSSMSRSDRTASGATERPRLRSETPDPARKSTADGKPAAPVKVSIPLAVVEGAVIGVLTGVVGAGGGFAIVPALVVLSRLPMRVAVGTSLTIIAAKSLAGFAGDLALQADFDWGLLLAFTALAVVGILAGSRIGRHVPGAKLRPAFGWFVLVAAAGILVRELLLG